MLEAYAVGQTIAATNGVVPFSAVTLIKGETAVLSGANTIQLNRCGVYMIDFCMEGLPGAAGTATVSMSKDGVLQQQATASVGGATTATAVTLPITTLVQVSENNTCCCCTSPTVIQFTNTGVQLTAARTHVVVTKVC